MNLTPAALAPLGYQPSPAPTTDRIPQMRALSTNACPNSSVTWLTDAPGACHPAMTTWGYCWACWERGFVPSAWAMRVDAAIGALL